ncbi:hypothetical protein [Streptomyces sp. NPDC090022]|uniref:hypothetical protein n=1 Tax=Streptomyces sp. NPDC090022 TaxID=3365920 RepID=UPI00380EB4C2
MRIPRPLLAAVAPALLLTAVAGTARAAGADFQYMGQDDRVHAIPERPGCANTVEMGGGGSRAVVNHTRKAVRLYRDRGCAGSPVAEVAPGASAPVAQLFRSVEFPA